VLFPNIDTGLLIMSYHVLAKSMTEDADQKLRVKQAQRLLKRQQKLPAWEGLKKAKLQCI
jgi:hypothetical protein